MASSPLLDAILAQLDRVTGPDREGWNTALCPFHDDHEHPNLRIKDGFFCNACGAKGGLQVLAHRLGVAAQPPALADRVITEYDYRARDGSLLFQAVRLFPKDFRQRRPDGAGGWIWDLKGVERVLYRLPELLAAPTDATVFVVEGEKDADHLSSLGLVATTCPMGAGKWLPPYNEALRGRQVVILPDNDEVGAKHAEQVRSGLRGVAATVRVLSLPDLPDKGDVSDWLEAGGDATQLAGLVSLTAPDEASPQKASRAVDGATFLLDSPSAVEAVWGNGEQVLWASGEPLMIVGPQGVGKTTLLQQLVKGLLGLQPELLGFVIKPANKVLLILADCPKQARRSFARMVSEADRAILAERLVIWQGPLPFDLGASPELFAPFVQQHGCDTVVIDSLKDVATDLSKDEVGSRVNRALQIAIAEGVEVASCHHQRKATAANAKPRSLSDVYGSVWLTAGCGSVLLLWGQAGDPYVEMTHLKQPQEEVGPLKLIHDHETGTTSVVESVDLLAVLRSRRGMTTEQAAKALFVVDSPTKGQVEKARRQLRRLAKDGLAHEEAALKGGMGGSEATLWFAVEDCQSNHESNHAAILSNNNHADVEQSRLPSEQIREGNHESNHANHEPFNHVRPSLLERATRDWETEEEQETAWEKVIE